MGGMNEDDAPRLPAVTLTEKHINFLVKGFARGKDYPGLKDDFLRFFGVPVDPMDVLWVEENHQDAIDRQTLEDAGKVARFAMGRASFRLEKLEVALDEAWKENTVRSVRTGPVGEETWEPIKERNLTEFRGLLDLGRKEEHGAKQLLLQALKLDLDASRVARHGVPSVTVNAGISEEEEDPTDVTIDDAE